MPTHCDDIAFVPGQGWRYEGPPEAGVASTNDELKEIMGTWLGKLESWDFYSTYTFSNPVNLASVDYWGKQHVRVLGAWNGNPGLEASHADWLKWIASRPSLTAARPARAFLGVERGNNGGLLHLHGLLANLGNLRAYCGILKPPGKWGCTCCMVHAWPCGIARVSDYDPALGAAHYVSKYVTKQLAEWCLIGFENGGEISVRREPPQVGRCDVATSAAVGKGFFRMSMKRTGR